jgi:RNA polymerase sigma-70 factor (ECF subfamily)
VTDLAIVDGPLDATVRLAATGDQAAFARLIAAHHASMARVAYAITGDRETAADAVQVAWSTAWRRLGSLRAPAQLRPWLVAIAANEARQIVRRQRRRTIVDIARVTDDPTGGDPGARISEVDLARALRALSPDDRTLLAMRFAAGLDSAEIAHQLGLSASGVRSRLARLLERLRMELDR